MNREKMCLPEEKITERFLHNKGKGRNPEISNTQNNLLDKLSILYHYTLYYRYILNNAQIQG